MKPYSLKHRGFSLAEVLIAIVITVIGLAGVTTALVYGVKNSARGKDITESAQLARTVLEYIQGTNLIDTSSPDEPWPVAESGLNDPEQARQLLNSTPFGGVVFTPQQVARYKRNIRVERLSEDENSHRFGLARVTVTITWQDNQGEHKSEMVGVVRHARI